MNFELASIISEVLHYFIVLTITGLIIYKNYENFTKLVINFYFICFVWGIICYIFQGCPITIFENWLFTIIYDKPRYPDYQFTDTDFYFLITNFYFYIPAVLALVGTYITKKYNA